MLARGAVGAPWLFSHVLGAAGPAPAEKLAEVRRFAAEAIAGLGPRAVGHLRQFWPKFRRHGALDKPLSLELMRARDEAEVRTLLGL
jgi:tRNA-dihydrouridine synthase